MSKLLKDPLVQIAEDINIYFIDKQLNESIKKDIISIIDEVRDRTGNKTWYIQRKHSIWEKVFNYWDSYYKKRVDNGMTKNEAYKLIASNVADDVGIKIGFKRVEHIINSRDTKLEKLSFHNGDKWHQLDIFDN